MKTIKEWFMYLPEPYRTEGSKYLDISGNQREPSLASAQVVILHRGIEQWSARWVHIPEVVSSNLAPVTN